MIRVQHIIDHSSDLAEPLPFVDAAAAAPWATTCESEIDARCPLPPGEYGDVIILHITASWSRLPLLTLLREDAGDRPIILVESSYSGDFESRCVVNLKRFHYLLALTYRLVDYVIVTNNLQRDWLLLNSLAPADKIVVLTPSVPAPDAFESADAPSTVRHSLRLGFWGGLGLQSGIDVLLDAFRLLEPGVASLDIFGYGHDHIGIAQLVGQGKDVTLSRSHSGDLSVLQRCDVFAFPSRWQPCSTNVLCAAAAGRGLITSSIADLHLFTDAAVGETVPVEAAEDLSDAIVRMSHKPIHGLSRATLAASATWRAESYCGWRNFVRSVTKLRT
jgi:glycosyltransferase involved in cell wall biosynthesis